MPRDLDLGLPRAPAAVADRRGVTAAGEVLHLTRSAVSQRIARLEALAGGPLLVRDRRGGLRPTPSGERLLGEARRLPALGDEIRADLGGGGGVDGPVRPGVPHDLAGAPLAPALGAHVAARPRAELALACAPSGELARRLADGRLDLAVLEEPAAGAGGETLAVDRLAWTGARGGTAFARTPLPDRPPTPAAVELARHLREAFARRRRQAA